jgi:putative ATP-binding cassette transporter
MSDDRLRAALDKVDLSALGARLDEVARWDQVLSNGERQRLAMARLLIHRPRVIILDDALSALEESAQAAMIARLRSELPEATIVSLAQRPAPPGVHDRHLVLERRADNTALMGSHVPALAEAK